MTTTKKLIGAAALAAGLSGGGIAGALLFAPAVSGAQTEEEAPADEDADVERHHPLQTAAEALGMTVDELAAELEAGKSIATVAEERGVDVQTVIDALVAEATERITEMVNQEGGFLHRHGPGRGPGAGFRVRLDERLAEAAAELGVTEDELRDALRPDAEDDDGS
jgi:hypothetical protein